MSFEQSPNDPMNFVKNMWGNMGFSLPGMVTPTFDVDEIEKKIKDMKAVEGWLKMNLSMLQMTIQSLEMQAATLNAVRAMGAMGEQQASPPWATSAPPAGAPAAGEGGGEALAQAAMWPWQLMQQMQEQMKQTAGEAPEEGGKPRAGSKRPKKAE